MRCAIPCSEVQCYSDVVKDNILVEEERRKKHFFGGGREEGKKEEKSCRPGRVGRFRVHLILNDVCGSRSGNWKERGRRAARIPGPTARFTDLLCRLGPPPNRGPRRSS